MATEEVRIVEANITTKDKSIDKPLSLPLSAPNVVDQILIIGTEQHPATDNKARNIAINWKITDMPVNAVMKFAMQAIRKVRLNTDQKWTVILCVGGYTEKQMNEIEQTLYSIKDQKGLSSVKHVLRCSKPSTIVKYINEGIHKGANVYVARSKEKIRRIGIYSHGIVGEFALWMGLYSDSQPFNIGWAKQMKKNSFLEGDTIIYSFACRTGLGNAKISDNVEYKEWGKVKRHDLMLDKSLAQAMSDASGGTTYAYLKRSSYYDTFNTTDELDFLDACDAHYGKRSAKRSNNKQDGKAYYHIVKNGLLPEDKIRYKELKECVDRRYRVDGQTFDPQGARHPVSTASTPLGLADGMQTFKPKK